MQGKYDYRLREVMGIEPQPWLWYDYVVCGVIVTLGLMAGTYLAAVFA